MDNQLSQRYQELTEELKRLFRELAALKAENQRLTRENITLREEVSLLRLYIDTYIQAGDETADLEALNLLAPPPRAEASEGAEPETDVLAEEAEASALTPDAIAFYNSLPESFNFSEMFELAELLGIEKQRMKGFMTIYLQQNMMQQHGTRVEKTGQPGELWDRPLGQVEQENAKRSSHDT